MDSIAQRRERLIPAVERSQEELRAALEDFQAVVLGRFDLRRVIAERPFPWLAGGLLFGLWVGWRR